MDLLVVEQALRFNIKIGFLRHAAVGIPVTLISLALLLAWLAATA